MSGHGFERVLVVQNHLNSDVKLLLLLRRELGELFSTIILDNIVDWLYIFRVLVDKEPIHVNEDEEKQVLG